MQFLLPIRIMNSPTPSQFLLTCSGSLVSGGRLVVVDREPHAVEQGSGNTAREHHEVSSDQVEKELRQAGFEIVGREDHFIDNDPLHENWWLIIARKP